MVLFGVGLVAIAGMVPANSPSESAREIVDFYADNATAVRIGMVLAMAGSGFFIPWGISLATQTRRGAPQHPILFHIQVACSVGACMLGVMFVIFGGLASFRPGEIAPDTTQMLNDALWFCWVFPGSYFVIWSVVVGIAILLDKHDDPVFPRWAGYFSVWAGLTYIPGCMALFFKSGPFAYNGLFVWWVPTVVFFFWILPMAYLTIRAASRQPAEVDDGVQAIADQAVVAEFARLRAELEGRREGTPEFVVHS